MKAKLKESVRGGTDETGEKKKVTKRVAKPKETKPKEPKPKAERKPRAARVPKVKKEKTNTMQHTEDAVLPKPELQQHVTVKEEASH